MSRRSNSLRSVRVLTVAAMLTALSVVIGIFCKNFLDFGGGLFRITFENFPILLAGILLGPAAGALVGAVSDTLSFFLSTQSFAISPLVTLGAALVGCVSGVVSHYIFRTPGVKRTVISAFAAHLIGSVLVKSVGLYVYYGWLILWRIPTYLLIAALESLLLCALQKRSAFEKIFKNYR